MAARHWWSLPSSNSEEDLRQWCLRMWRRMDRDNSGALTRQELECEEFYTIVRCILLQKEQSVAGMGGPGYARAEMDINQAIDFALRKADINNDGKLSFQEFMAFILVLRRPQLATHTANLIFALFDVSRDLHVDAAEFRQIFRFYLGRAPTETEFQEEWERLDSENKGKVSREDYVKWLRTSENPTFRVHSPQPMSEVMSGTAEFHAAKRESMTSPMAAKPISPMATSQGQWRPWHPYTNMCWAQVPQVPFDMDASGASWRASQSLSSTATSSLHVSQRMSRSTASLSDSQRLRPPWNQRLATSNPNWPDLTGKPRRPKSMRNFLSTPQSAAELKMHFQETPGFERHLKKLRQPENTGKQSKGSPDRLDALLSPEILPGRSKSKHGHMRNPMTGKREHWKDDFLSPPQIREKYVNGTNSLRSLGEPPRYMTVDVYDDTPS